MTGQAPPSQWDLTCLNVVTRYPSIFTYHAMNAEGRLTTERTVEFAGPVEVTEKVDGVNARLILHPFPGCDPIIGSREELLHRVGDLIRNPVNGIVDTVLGALHPFAYGEGPWLPPCGEVTVVYGEVHGGRLPGADRYTGAGAFGFRVFDVATVVRSAESPVELRFASTIERAAVAGALGLELVPVLELGAPPAGLEEALEWLEVACARSLALLDSGAGGLAEGVVVRSLDRKRIAKLRLGDYQRHRDHERLARTCGGPLRITY